MGGCCVGVCRQALFAGGPLMPASAESALLDLDLHLDHVLALARRGVVEMVVELAV